MIKSAGAAVFDPDISSVRNNLCQLQLPGKKCYFNPMQAG